MRYRGRADAHYKDKWLSTGFRFRTGNPIKQQDPQLTLGNGSKEFGTLPLGLERAYFQGKWTNCGFWVGKNNYPFEKNNELFWSDNVYPEGVTCWKSFQFSSQLLDSVNLKAGHFIMTTAGRSLNQDEFFQGYQAYFRFLDNRFELFPSFYLFKNLSNIPDGGETFTIDYSILHVGSRINLLKKRSLNLELDYYYNLQDYSSNDSIPSNLSDQKTGFTVGMKYGSLKKKGNFLGKASYTNLQ